MRLVAIVLVGAALTLAASAGASAKPSTVKCHNYTYPGRGFSDKYTRIRATGLKCGHADEVLGTFSNSAAGASDLGYTCRTKKTKKRHVYDLKCTRGSRRITAVATFTS